MRKAITLALWGSLFIPVSCDIWEQGVVDKEVCHLYHSEFLDNLSLYIEDSPGFYIENYTPEQERVEDQTLHTIRVNFDYNKAKYSAYLDSSKVRKEAVRKFEKETLKNLREHGSTDLYTTSSISGKVTVTSNESIFGEVPGSDLSKYIYVPNTPANKYLTLVTSPDYSIVYPRGSEKPTSLNEYYFDGSIISQARIIFKGIPTTGITSAELTMNIPVEDVLYLDAFEIDGSFNDSKVTKRTRTISGKIKIEF